MRLDHDIYRSWALKDSVGGIAGMRKIASAPISLFHDIFATCEMAAKHVGHCDHIAEAVKVLKVSISFLRHFGVFDHATLR